MDHLHKKLDHYYDDFMVEFISLDIFLIQNKLEPLLQTISSIDEMHHKAPYYKNTSEKGRKYVFGLIRANNLIKHNKITIEVLTENTIPLFSFPLEIPMEGTQMGLITIVWKQAEYIPDDNDKNWYRRQQILNFEDFIGKEITIAIKEAVAYLEEMKIKY